MFNNKLFWRAQHLFLLVFWAFAIALVITGHLNHWLVMLAAVILLAHVAEIPLALRMLKDKHPKTGRLAINTLLYGYTWWVPARRGVFPVN
jgi:hypothetical protein